MPVAIPRLEASTPQERRVAALFESHHARVFRAARRITGNDADAEDVLQTVFLRVVRGEMRLEPEDRAAVYLHRAAVHGGLDVLRRRRAAKADPIDEAVPALADESIAADRALETRQLEATLRAAIAALPEREAEFFTLRYLEGFGNREIARMTGASWGTVAVTLHRARTRLRAALDGGAR